MQAAFLFVLCGVPHSSFIEDLTRFLHAKRSPLRLKTLYEDHMNRTVFSLPPRSDYRTARGLEVARLVEEFTGGRALDDLIDLLDRRRGVVLSSGTTVPGRYESFDLGFADPPLRLEATGTRFFIDALNARGKTLIAFLGDTINDPAVVFEEKSATRPVRSGNFIDLSTRYENKLPSLVHE